MSHPSDDSPSAFIHDLIRSHHQLPNSQFLSILASLSNQLASCDEEVARLRARIDELGRRRVDLQEQYDQCQTLFAPARRLPSEILGEIFALTADVTTERSPDESEMLALRTLAQADILAISQVCARWRAISSSTSSLWTTIRLHPTLWRTHGTAKKAMALLECVLGRIGQRPLTIHFTNTSGSLFHGPALELLAQHSARWRAATFRCPASHFQHLSAAKGNLPLLEILEIDATGSQPVTVFEIAPNLRNFTIGDPLGPPISTPALDQVSNIRHLYLSSADIANALSTTSRLSSANSFTLQFYLDDWTSNRTATLSFGIAPISTDIGHLAIELLGDFFKHHCMQALSAIFTALTLPRLTSLAFASEAYPRFPLQWPHAQFLVLAQRSAFHTHLHELDLCDIQITEAQLVQCLTALPALTTLAIADHQRVGRGVNLVLITDALLRSLTRLPDKLCLVPQLHTLRLRSRLEFSDNFFEEFVVSRVNPERRFKCILGTLAHWNEPQGRRINEPIVWRLRELVVQGHLTMGFPSSQ
ncbi:F-box domain-containing protein [Mycena sanguinolenta]|uniref:F-box domain-containing protein n=1 Tax=Mycena sanguinolenta TaxID=230812 RepID=A0A8H6YLD6_9AGAR|nr:F-box domain-containing protein [Mycena sanguinolenta]